MKNRGTGLLIALAAALIIAIGVVVLVLLTPARTTVKVEATEAAKMPGQIVTLDVVVSGNSEFTDLETYVEYDRERLEFVRFEDSYTDMEGNSFAYLSDVEVQTDVLQVDGLECGYLKISSLQPIGKEEKSVIGLTFLIRPEAEIGVANVSLFGEKVILKKGGNEEVIACDAEAGGILVGKTTCRHIDNDLDVYCDLCGAQLRVVEKFEMTQTDLNMKSVLTLQFVLPKELLSGEDYAAVITHTKSNGVLTEEVPYKNWEELDPDHYVLFCTVEPQEMTDDISVSVIDGEGYQYNYDYTVSVRELVHSRLAEEETDELAARMYVDLLNYGAEMQLYQKYKTEDLANSQLTEEQKALASPEYICKDTSVRGTNYMGASLTLKEAVTINTHFEGFGGKNAGKMYAQITYMNAAGEKETDIIPGAEFKLFGENQGRAYRIEMRTLPIMEAKTPITVTVYNEDGTEHGMCVDSVESYIARSVGEDTAAVYAAFMKLSGSSYAYFTS